MCVEMGLGKEEPYYPFTNFVMGYCDHFCLSVCLCVCVSVTLSVNTIKGELSIRF